MLYKKLFAILFSLLLISAVAGCGGGTSEATNPWVIPSIETGTATLAWNAPTTYTDMSPLTPAGYKIYYGTSSGTYTNVITVADGQATEYTVNNLAPDTYFFTVTAYDASGNESNYATPEAWKVIN